MKKIDDVKLIYKGIVFINGIEKGLIQLMILEAILAAFFPFVNVYMTSMLIDGILAYKAVKELLKIVLIALLINGLTLLVKSLFEHLIKIKIYKFEKEFNFAISNKMSRIKYETLESPEVHNLRMSIEEVKTIYGSRIQKIMIYFPNLVSSFFSIIFSVSVTMSLFLTKDKIYASNPLIIGPVFTAFFILVLLVLIIVSVICTSKFTTKKINYYDEYTPFIKFSDYYQNHYLDSYHAGKDIRLYNQKKILEDEFLKSHEECKRIDNLVTKIVYKSENINSIISYTIAGLSYTYVALKALGGYLSIGMIVKYVQSLNQFVQGFAGFMNTAAALFTSNEYIKKTLDFMSIEEETDIGKKEIGDIENLEIEFQDVYFKYPNQKEYTLEALSLKINLHDNLAVVGENGSGKSTFVKLLCGLYQPTKGKILLNGVDVNEYKRLDYMMLFAVVFQDSNIFSFSIGANVAVNDEYEPEKIMANLDKVKFDYRKFKEGIASNLYKDFFEDGIEISGGEKQKLTIARALNKQAEVIILDEPTAALDPISEFELYQNFANITKGKTTICISHRLSSCILCDKIIVFHKGKIIQSGSHEVLMEDQRGKYFELWNAQAVYYK